MCLYVYNEGSRSLISQYTQTVERVYMCIMRGAEVSLVNTLRVEGVYMYITELCEGSGSLICQYTQSRMCLYVYNGAV